MGTNKKGKARTIGLQILIGEVIVTFITIVVTLAFLESGIINIIRNILVVGLIFLTVYVVWIKLFGNYEKFYKFGLKEE